jgi:hypothetical protein
VTHADRLLRLARGWFDERTVVLIFEPLVADLQKRPAGTVVRLLPVSVLRQLTERVDAAHSA